MFLTKDKAIPKFAVRAYLLDAPRARKDLSKKVLTSQNFNAWKGHSKVKPLHEVSLEWSEIRKKFKGVALLTRPLDRKEKDYRAAYDKFKKLYPQFSLPKLGVPAPRSKQAGGPKGKQKAAVTKTVSPKSPQKTEGALFEKLLKTLFSVMLNA